MATKHPTLTNNDSPTTSEPKKSEPRERIPMDAIPYFKVARKLALSYNRAIHHQKYLNDCLTKRTIPKGLQLKVAAQIPEPNLQFTLKWETAHLKFSKELTSILAEYYGERVTSLSTQIESTKESLVAICDPPTLTNIEQIIKDLEKTQAQSLQERRERKTGATKTTNSEKTEKNQSTTTQAKS